MDEVSASRTALAASLMRAVHTRCDPVRILDDPWGDRFITPSALQALEQFAASVRERAAGDAEEPDLQTAVDRIMRANPGYANVILRGRYTEDALEQSIAAGIRQYVLIGAGFDSYALRRSAAATSLEIFEVDHPATQALKRQRLEDCETDTDEHLHFVAADLGEENLHTALSRTGFDFDAPAFFSWLGVTMYLPRAANEATLDSVARCGAAGSQLVFSYIDSDLFGDQSGEDGQAFSELQESVARMGEPFVCGFEPNTLVGDLKGRGLLVEEDVSDAQLAARYDPAGENRLGVSDKSRLARVRIADSAN
jgi:methyltransferase (TIGR00027 family)